MSLPPQIAARSSEAPPTVRRRLDQVVRRIRLLHLVAGVSRVVAYAIGLLVLSYAADRLLDLPLGVRAALLVAALLFVGRETWRRVIRPLVRGPDRLAAARLVEGVLGDFEGRLVTVLQLEAGGPGSLEDKVHQEAAAACESVDLRAVLRSRPSWLELLRASGAGLVLTLLLVLVEPYVSIYVSRWTLHDRAWPRDTTLELIVPEDGAAHVLLPDGTLVAARGGVLPLLASFTGRRPDDVELVVRGADGDRTHAMSSAGPERFAGHFTVKPGDEEISVRGGDDDGDATRRALRVVDPPRLDEPEFVIEPPAYLGEPSSVVGPEGLSVAEGSRITLRGRPSGEASSGRLLLASSVEPVPLELHDDGDGVTVSASFVAEDSDTLSLELEGAYGLRTPDPSQHALLVHKDHPPALRIYAPARSDVKVTKQAVVLFSVVAEDDHGVASVEMLPTDGDPRAFTADPAHPGQYRLVLDLPQLGVEGTVSYALRATDRRQLAGRGPQSISVEGRRVDVVDASEVQRLLGDRQLRLKEAFLAIRDRQQRARESVDDLRADPPAPDDPDLVAAAVAQNQVTTRLVRETKELCGILEETITNRLDPGPGAGPVLDRYLADWRARPVDETFASEAWGGLAKDYADGRFGRLDTLGRLLDMASLALQLGVDLSPAAYDRLQTARGDPSEASLAAAAAAQAEVATVLDRLLERMDEWEDYQEVLSLVKTLIDDQKALRVRTQQTLRKEP
ncbi:MAG: hypothetical protein H6825_15970 [Planctomycetes bacterium]|nr:hypothetical protein [Planctomycetota bacterium]